MPSLTLDVGVFHPASKPIVHRTSYRNTDVFSEPSDHSRTTWLNRMEFSSLETWFFAVLCSDGVFFVLRELQMRGRFFGSCILKCFPGGCWLSQLQVSQGPPPVSSFVSLTSSEPEALYFMCVIHLQCPPQLLAPLVNMSKTGYTKICLCCLSSWSFTQNIHKNLTFS